MDELLLRQFVDLKREDFQKYPVWINCHNVDYNQGWYDDTDEETFRPWHGAVPVSSAKYMYLVAANFKSNDGTSYDGFITPAVEPFGRIDNVLGMMQPYIFVSTKMVGFWYGLMKPSKREIDDIYKLFDKSSRELFPILFAAKSKISEGVSSGTLSGFYYLEKNGKMEIII